MTNKEKAELTYKAIQARKRKRERDIAQYQFGKMQTSVAYNNNAKYRKRVGFLV